MGTRKRVRRSSRVCVPSPGGVVLRPAHAATQMRGVSISLLLWAGISLCERAADVLHLSPPPPGPPSPSELLVLPRQRISASSDQLSSTTVTYLLEPSQALASTLASWKETVLQAI